MSERDRESLADQAAAWVPPWARPAPPRPATPQPDPEPEPRPDPAARSQPDPEPDVVPEPTPEPEPDLTAEPAPDHGLVAEPEPVAAPEPEVAAEPQVVTEPAVAAEPEVAPEPPAMAGTAADGAGVRPGEEPLPAPTDLRGALEAILLVVDEPVTDILLAQILEEPTQRVSATLQELSDEYTRQGRGFELRRAAGGWRLYTRAEFAPYVERFVLDGQQTRLTQAALETLAVVAYKQPVSRSRISAIRGVNCDGVVRTLVSRGLIEECGTEPESGAFLYRTTPLFLEKLGIDSVADLPPLAPFLPDNVDEIADAQR